MHHQITTSCEKKTRTNLGWDDVDEQKQKERKEEESVMQLILLR